MSNVDFWVYRIYCKHMQDSSLCVLWLLLHLVIANGIIVFVSQLLNTFDAYVNVIAVLASSFFSMRCHFLYIHTRTHWQYKERLCIVYYKLLNV